MGSGSKREARRRSRPGIEALEGRAVPATFHAANVVQLEADIAAVNNTSGPNTIILAAHEFNLTGALDVRNPGNLTIMGGTNKGASTNIVGPNLNRALEIDGGTVTLRNLTVSGGGFVAYGGGILTQDANLTVDRSVISGNLATQSGGGIFAQGGTLNVTNSSILGNTASGQANPSGGGIAANNAQVNISNSTINNNSAFGSNLDPQATAIVTGGAIFTQGGTLNITGSRLTNNTATAYTSGPNAVSSGGGVSTINTVATVARSTIETNALSTIAAQVNTVQGSAFSTVGGSLTVAGSTLSSNVPGGKSVFYQSGASVVVGNSTVDGQKITGNLTLGDNGFAPGG